jgi:hypothetical protein
MRRGEGSPAGRPERASLSDRSAPEPDRFPSRTFWSVTWRIGLRLLPVVVAFVILDLAWAALMDTLDILRGSASTEIFPLGAGPALLDALWHLGSAALLTLAAQDRRVTLLAPPLALLLDLDHIFGYFVPTALGRPDHDLVFAVLVMVLLAWRFGRFPGAVAGTAILAHMAVDGGDFPLFAPLTWSRWSFPFPLQVALCVVVVAGFVLAVQAPRRLWDPRTLLLGALGVLVVAVLLAVAAPSPTGIFLSH